MREVFEEMSEAPSSSAAASKMGKHKVKGPRTIPFSQDQRKLLLSIIPNEKSLSSRSIDNEADHPQPASRTVYFKPTLFGELDIEGHVTLNGALSFFWAWECGGCNVHLHFRGDG